MAKSDSVTRRFEYTGDTKRYRKYQITEEMEDTAREKGVKDEEIKEVTGTLYVGKDKFSDDKSIFVSVSASAPKGFVDSTVE